MKLQNIFLILALITNIKVMILFLNKNNIELMLNFSKLETPRNGLIVNYSKVMLFGR